MTRRRVVITGLGLISPVGNTVAEGWANLVAGRSGIDTVTRFDASGLSCRFAGEETPECILFDGPTVDFNAIKTCFRQTLKNGNATRRRLYAPKQHIHSNLCIHAP